MRTWLRRFADPVFNAVVSRFDTTIEIETHYALAQRVLEQLESTDSSIDFLPEIARRVRAVTNLGTVDRAAAPTPSTPPEPLLVANQAWHAFDLGAAAAVGDPTGPSSREVLSTPEIWANDPAGARRAAIQLSLGLESDAGPDDDGSAIARAALDALPPRQWFLFKRGTYFGSSNLLTYLIRTHAAREANAVSSLVEVESREVLDRLIRHVEVRRENALGFEPKSLPADEDALTERLRFAVGLFEASEVFDDLRYLNTGMKLVDAAVAGLERDRFEARDPRSRKRHIAYLVALSTQEERLQKVWTI
jgi:hypothetical protein